MTAFGVFYINQVKIAKGWKIVKGHIIDLDIEEISGADQNTSMSYYPDIKYEYSYAGQAYFNQSIVFHSSLSLGLPEGVFAGTESDVQDFLKKYSLNSTIDVYVNPKNPTESIIVNNFHIRDFIYLIAGFLLISLALHLFIFRKAYFYHIC